MICLINKSPTRQLEISDDLSILSVTLDDGAKPYIFLEDFSDRDLLHYNSKEFSFKNESPAHFTEKACRNPPHTKEASLLQIKKNADEINSRIKHLCEKSYITEEQQNTLLNWVQQQQEKLNLAAEQCEKICKEFNYIPGTMQPIPSEEIRAKQFTGKIVVLQAAASQSANKIPARLFMDKNICFAWYRFYNYGRYSDIIEFFFNHAEMYLDYSYPFDYITPLQIREATRNEIIYLIIPLLQTGLTRFGIRPPAEDIEELTKQLSTMPASKDELDPNTMFPKPQSSDFRPTFR